MKVKMLDTVETGHTLLPDLDPQGLDADQDGLRVTSAVETEVNGMAGTHCVCLLSDGAELELPDRLAKRLIKIGHAEELDD